MDSFQALCFLEVVPTHPQAAIIYFEIMPFVIHTSLIIFKHLVLCTCFLHGCFTMRQCFLTSSCNIPNDCKCTIVVWATTQVGFTRNSSKSIFVYYCCMCDVCVGTSVVWCENGGQRTILWRLFSHFMSIWTPGTEPRTSGFWDKLFSSPTESYAMPSLGIYSYTFATALFSTYSAAFICDFFIRITHFLALHSLS